MAMGKRRDRQAELFIAADRIVEPAANPFYGKLNELLAEAGFDAFVESICRPYYESVGPGRPSIAPGMYFRMLLIGYFEGLDSQRGIAWRVNDGLSLRHYLGVPLTERTPEHSTLTRTRQRLPEEVHNRVFQFALKIAADKGLLSVATVGVDSTFLEANAAMKTIVRKDTGEDYKQFLTRIAAAAGIVNPTDEEPRRFDRKRKDKKCSNDEWESKTDADARIMKMKDGRTHMTYKAEHVVDLDSEFVLAAEICHGVAGDAETFVDSVLAAQANLDQMATLTDEPPPSDPVERDARDQASAGAGPRIRAAVADKGYHKASTLELAEDVEIRTYIAEPQRKDKRKWDDKPLSHQRAVRNNRRRLGRSKSKALHRKRSERVERTFAHICETGGARRTWLRGIEKVTKRYRIAAAAHNLALIMRKLFGIGKPKRLQRTGGAAFEAVSALLRALRTLIGSLRLQNPLTIASKNRHRHPSLKNLTQTQKLKTPLLSTG